MENHICAECKHSFAAGSGVHFEVDSCLRFHDGQDLVTGRKKYRKCREHRGNDVQCFGYEKREVVIRKEYQLRSIKPVKTKGWWSWLIG